MIPQSGISGIVKALVVQMALKIGAPYHKGIKAFQGFYVRKVLIGGGDNPPRTPPLHGGFNVFEQQNKASLFDKADGKGKGAAPPQILPDFLQKRDLCVVGQKLMAHSILPK